MNYSGIAGYGEVRWQMKQIAKRTLNLLPIWAVAVFAIWIYDLIQERQSNDGIYYSLGILGITLLFNYVFFGRLTLWHKGERIVDESEK